MKHIELNKDKLFYSIGEVAKMFDVNASLIRFWEKEFKQIEQVKTAHKLTEPSTKKIDVVLNETVQNDNADGELRLSL
mgnify:CR=1 FL=1